MLTGTTLGRGIATSTCGLSVAYTLVRVDKTLENIAELAQAAKYWRALAQPLALRGGDPGRRATFAEEVMGVCVENLRLGVGSVAVAQAIDGRVLSVCAYILEPARKEGYLHLLATSPDQVPGAGDPTTQLRGAGTGIVAAVSRDMLAHGTETIFLHAKDAEAARFWSGRGFVTCGLGGLLCVRGRPAIEALRGSCDLKPNCPDHGDCLECGRPGATLHVRLPGQASPVPAR